MKNFFQVLRLSLRHRWTLVGIILSSLAVALFWAANLGTVYPIVNVGFQGQSLSQWVEKSIETAEQEITDRSAEIERLKSEMDGSAGDHHLQTQIDIQEMRVAAEQRALGWARKMQPWANRYLPATPFRTLQLVVALLLIGTVLKSVFLITNVILVERLVQLTVFDTRKLVYRNVLSMSLADFGQDRTSRLMSHLTHDVNGLVAGLTTIFGRGFREPLKIIACFCGAAFICWRLLLLSLIVTPVAMYLINLLAKSVRRANRRAMDEMARMYGHLFESLHGIQEVKAFTMERFERRRFHYLAKEYLRKSLKIVAYHSLNKPSTELMGMLVVSMAILVGGYLVLNQETHLFGLRICNRPMNFGALIAFFAFLAGVSDPSRKLAEVYNQIQQGGAAADRLYGLIQREPGIPQAIDPVPLPAPLQALQIDNVHFHYEPSAPVLQDVSLRLPAGETLAVVGPNGCGKSSLVNLMLRFYDPISGSVKWNGVDLRQLRLRDIRQQIGMVTQHTLLFDDTVMNNIRYGRLGATDDEVIEAARKAHADSFIRQQLASSYQTVVGQGGKMLSGGQRQRIALARAILRDPQLLILDEATSQVDLESESLIHQVLKEFLRDRTAIVITHRLSTLQLASRVLVLDEGRIADIGRHDELITRCDLYRRLHQIQFRQSA